MLNPDLKYILVQFYFDAYRMGSLSGHFITTHAKLEAIKRLPAAYYHDVLGKHSEIRVQFDDPKLFTVVSEDQAFIAEAARVFKADQGSGHLLGFDPFWYVCDGEWDDGDEGIPVPWMLLDAPDPATVELVAE